MRYVGMWILLLVCGTILFNARANSDEPQFGNQKDARPASRERDLQSARKRYRDHLYEERQQSNIETLERRQVRHFGYERLVLFQRLLGSTIAEAIPNDVASNPDLRLTLSHDGRLKSVRFGHGTEQTTTETHGALDWSFNLKGRVLALISIEEPPHGELLGVVVIKGMPIQVSVPYVGHTEPALNDAAPNKKRTIDEALPELAGKSIRDILKGLLDYKDEKPDGKRDLKKRTDPQSHQEVRSIGYARLARTHFDLKKLDLKRDCSLSFAGELGRAYQFAKDKAVVGDPYENALEWNLMHGGSKVATIAISTIEMPNPVGTISINGMLLYMYIPFVKDNKTLDDELPELGNKTLRWRFEPLYLSEVLEM